MLANVLLRRQCTDGIKDESLYHVLFAFATSELTSHRMHYCHRVNNLSTPFSDLKWHNSIGTKGNKVSSNVGKPRTKARTKPRTKPRTPETGVLQFSYWQLRTDTFIHI